MNKKGVVKIVSEKRAWFERLLGAVFFSIAVYIIILYFLNNSHTFTEEYYVKNIRVLTSLVVLIGFGIRFTYTINHHFNFNFMKYRVFYSVGPFGVGKWKKLYDLDRVSTFLNSRKECEVNIWDIKNNRYRVSNFDSIEDAVAYGRDLAKNLEIKFLERN